MSGLSVSRGLIVDFRRSRKLAASWGEIFLSGRSPFADSTVSGLHHPLISVELLSPEMLRSPPDRRLRTV